MVLAQGVTQLVSGVLTVIGVAVVMLLLNWRLALVTLVTIPVTMLRADPLGGQPHAGGLPAATVIAGQTERPHRGDDHQASAWSRRTAANETVMEEFDVSNQSLRRAATQAQIFSGFIGPMMNFVNNIGLAIVAGVGGWMTIQGLATVGTIASFINYARQFGRPLNEIASLYNSLQSAVAGAERVFETIDEVPEQVDAPDALPLTQVKGDVVFDDVSFGYEEGVPVLKHVSLHAEPGQVVALVGPTGAGKTTIVNLLTRFYDVDGGRICIDGRDICDLQAR